MYTCMWSGKNFSVTAVPKYFEDIFFCFCFLFLFFHKRQVYFQTFKHMGFTFYTDQFLVSMHKTSKMFVIRTYAHRKNDQKD